MRLSRLAKGLGLLALLAIFVVAVSCGDSKQGQKKDAKAETGNVDTGQLPDLTSDTGNKQDSPWPDKGADVWPADTTYGGAPFGCMTNADCFGQKCCPTPWGIRMCASSCGP